MESIFFSIFFFFFRLVPSMKGHFPAAGPHNLGEEDGEVAVRVGGWPGGEVVG